MEFLDNSGHIFSLPSYKEEPIGYEFEENKYVFWVESTTNDLSVNNFYCKVINIVIPFNGDETKSFGDLVNINISIDSSKFWLLRPEDIQSKINLNESINFNISDKKKELSNNDLFVVTFNEKDSDNWAYDNVAVIPIYILTNSDEEGTWMTNILIHVFNKENVNVTEETWCPITVGALYVKENEILTINGQNLGINLPKDIFKSVYQCSFINEEFNEALYNEKIKEYIINYMDIKGEVGNYKSAINSLKWFGYGDKITLTKLIKTDNEIKNQFINDFFNISNDMIKSFRYFKNTTLLSLKLKANQETSETYEINKDNMFWGEGKPIIEDLFDKYVEIKEGYCDSTWSYWKPYYDFTFYEMGLKLSCLQYYYETYFLPIHLRIHSASITHQVFANDIKFNNYVYGTNITEPIINLEDSYIKNKEEYELDNDDVKFESNNVRYFNHQLHYVDDNFNEFTNYNSNNNDDDLYIIDETCLNVPITFTKNNKLYNCVLILEKEQLDIEMLWPYELKVINKPINLFYYDIKIKNTKNELLDLNNLYFAYKQNNEISPYIQGIDNFKEYLKNSFKHSFTLNSNNNKINLNIQNYVDIPIDISNEEFINESQEYINNEYYVYIPSINELGINPMNPNDIIGFVYIIPKVDLVIKYNENEINDFIIYHNDINLSLLNNIKINKIKETTFIYESHFSFIQNNDQKYHSFVLYPKILNKLNINYFVNQKFILRLLVNNKWYKYEFISKMPDLNLEFGTLKYKYWDNSDNYTSHFTQLSDITNTNIEFNSFMYEPDLIKVNHINYIEDINTYIKLNNLLYVSNDYPDLKLGNFNKYIIINDNANGTNVHTKVYFHKNIDAGNQILGDFYITNDLSKYKSLRVLDKNNIFGELNIGGFKKIIDNDIHIQQTNINTYFKINDDNKEQLSVNHIVLSDVENMHQKYINKVNINEFNELNNIHIFDIYSKNYLQPINNILYLHNANIKCNYNINSEEKSFYIKGIFEDNKYKIILNNDDSIITEYKIDIGNNVNVNVNNDEIKYICTLFINKFSDLFNIENLNIEDYIFEDNSEYTSIFGYFKYQNDNINDYIKIYDKNSIYLNKDICINISYYKNDKYTELTNISKENYEKLLNEEPLNDMLIKIEFYETINNENNNKIYYVDIPKEEKNPNITINGKLYKLEINNEGKYFCSNPIIQVDNIVKYYEYKETIYIEENDDLTIPFNYFSNTNVLTIDTLLKAGLVNNDESVSLTFEYECSDNENIKIYINNTLVLNNKISFDLSKNDNFKFFINIKKEILSNLNNICIIPKLYIEKNDYSKLKYEYGNDDDINEIIVDGKLYKYGNNTSKDVINLYNDFFEKNNEYNIIKQNINLNNMYLDYDFYLMHDLEYWYGVFISKQTISKTYTPNQLKITDENKILYLTNNDKYELRYVSSGNEFLLNRMKYIPNNSINHFNSKDMIVGKILSNNKLPVNIFDSSKWEITPMSIGISDNVKINSNSEMCLLSFPKTNNRYQRGYYNVNVRYSLDGNTQQQYIKTGKIRID